MYQCEKSLESRLFEGLTVVGTSIDDFRIFLDVSNTRGFVCDSIEVSKYISNNAKSELTEEFAEWLQEYSLALHDNKEHDEDFEPIGGDAA